MTKQKLILIVGLAVLLFFIVVTSISSSGKNDISSVDYSEWDLNKLTSVLTNDTLDELIIEYEGFTVSFNRKLHLPNWVAWVLTKERLENKTGGRRDQFRPDDEVNGCASLMDYKGSGYERGHMVPAGDMKWSKKALDDASFLTNICPQIHDLNNGAWRSLEEKCRANVTRDSALIIICGPVVTVNFKDTIGITPLPVPQAYFKVILSPWSPKGPYSIGFIMNNGKVKGGMQAAVCSVDDVEELTGHDFFSFLPDSVENRLESMKDFSKFSY
ncbi:MAG: DNA/RNA non-specific endonuclease [Muribaculaceae bacterium]|nr:DNA/RNA non-specific endonuclease [Muribaculaceae bacterium]